MQKEMKPLGNRWEIRYLQVGNLFYTFGIRLRWKE